MKHWSLLFSILLLDSNSIQQTEQVGIPISKPAVLHFPATIIDVEAGNKDYHLKIKGKSLLVFAQDKNAKPTTLFVRYGEEQDSYVLDIYPDEGAALQRSFGLSKPDQEQDADYLFPPGIEQEYYDYGNTKDGISIILTNIVHKDKYVHLRFFIENQTSTHLQLDNCSFNYVSLLRKFLFLEEKKKKPVKASITPSRIQLADHTEGYFIFSLPYYSTNGWLEVYLGETDKQGERDFVIEIPHHTLIQARRKR